MFHKLKSVTPLPDYTLLANFSDGSVKSYDFRRSSTAGRPTPRAGVSRVLGIRRRRSRRLRRFVVGRDRHFRRGAVGARRRRRKPVLRSALVRRRHRPMGSQRKRPAQSRGIPEAHRRRRCPEIRQAMGRHPLRHGTRVRPSLSLTTVIRRRPPVSRRAFFRISDGVAAGLVTHSARRPVDALFAAHSQSIQSSASMSA